MDKTIRPKIERRRFAGIDGSYMELTDFEARWPGRKPDRVWTAFCAWFPDVEATVFLGRFPDRWRVEPIPSVKPRGTWLMGGHWWLEQALEELESAGG